MDVLRTNILKPLILTSLALVAFAANSVLCRLALGGKAIGCLLYTSDAADDLA